MNDKQGRDKQISKFLSLVLRHQPETIGLRLDGQGWARVEELLDACEKSGTPLTRVYLEHIVATSDKKRFSFSDDRLYIRANQGHSVQVDLGYEPQEPPSTLYHGTARRFLESIRREGLNKGRRHHVHLSSDEVTAVKVGSRHGKPIVLKINSGQMHLDGYAFHLSENGVWLTDHVPPDYIVVIE
jgi:putative RNA 2'-phosphotransferase